VDFNKALVLDQADRDVFQAPPGFGAPAR
jgi:hypothetical protein